jgi:hypothetical protein
MSGVQTQESRASCGDDDGEQKCVISTVSAAVHATFMPVTSNGYRGARDRAPQCTSSGKVRGAERTLDLPATCSVQEIFFNERAFP